MATELRNDDSGMTAASVRQFKKIIDNRIAKSVPKPVRSRKAIVKRIDTNGTVWADIVGGEGSTPIEVVTTTTVPGDLIDVRIQDGKAYGSAASENPAVTTSYLGEIFKMMASASKGDTVVFDGTVLQVDNVLAGTIQAMEGSFTELRSEIARINKLEVHDFKAVNAQIVDLSADTAKIHSLTAEELSAATAYIAALTAENISVSDLAADHAAVGSLDATYAQIDLANIANGTIKTAMIDDGQITSAKIGNAAITTAKIDDAAITTAKIQNAAITTALIADEAVGDSKIASVSANKLTAGTIDAGKINVVNLHAKNLVVDKINGQPVLGGLEYVSPSSTGYSSKNPSTEGWYELVNGSFVLSSDTEVDDSKAYYRTGTSTMLYDQAYIDSLESGLNDRIDGAIETFTSDAVPTLLNYPASDWSASEYASHVGDVCYVVNAASQADGYCYRFAYDSTEEEYGWVLIKDSDVTAALQRLLDAEGDISSLQSFQTTTSTWITNTDTEIGSLQSAQTSLETRMTTAEGTLQTKVDTTTFNSVSNTVDSHTQTISSLSTTVQTASTNASSALSAANTAVQTAMDGAFLVITSTNGQLFKNGTESTILQVAVFPNGGDRCDTLAQVRSRFGASAYIEWKWKHDTDEQWGTLLSNDSHISHDGMWLTVTPADVAAKTSFSASLVVPGEED